MQNRTTIALILTALTLLVFSLSLVATERPLRFRNRDLNNDEPHGINLEEQVRKMKIPPKIKRAIRDSIYKNMPIVSDRVRNMVKNAEIFGNEAAIKTREAIDIATNKISQVASDVKETVETQVPIMAEKTVEMVQTASEITKGIAGKTAEATREVISNTAGVTREYAEIVGESIKENAPIIKEKISQGATQAAQTAKDIIDKTVEKVQETAPIIKEKASDAVQKATEVTSEYVNEAKEMMGKTAGTLNDVVQENVVPVVRSVVDSAKGGLSNLMEEEKIVKEKVEKKAGEMKDQAKKTAHNIKKSM